MRYRPDLDSHKEEPLPRRYRADLAEEPAPADSDKVRRRREALAALNLSLGYVLSPEESNLGNAYLKAWEGGAFNTWA